MSSHHGPLVDRVLAGDRRALARAISIVEDEAGAEIVRALFARTGRAYRIGVTGPPGAGKSTLVDRMTTELRAGGQTVGIIAVDPSSPFTGGAVLGDRVRMQLHADDPGVFIRSMATRGHLGGLSRTTDEVALVMDAAGFDVVLIETVGVGQDEVDVVRTADISIVTVAPQSGDDVQALKAGIMEIGDVFVVNKADLDGADRTRTSIEAMLSLQPIAEGAWRAPVLLTVATSGQGVREVLATVTGFRDRAAEAGASRRRLHYEARLREILGRRFVGFVERDLLEPGELEGFLDRIETRALDLYSAADEIMSRTRAADRDSTRIMKATLDHVGIAVADLDAALAFYRDALGLEVGPSEEVASQGVRVHFIGVGHSAIELLEATTPDSPIGRFLERRGPGIHHLTLRVDDLAAALAGLKRRGARLIDETPRRGAEGALVAFVHPSSAHGVLVELTQVRAPRSREEAEGGT